MIPNDKFCVLPWVSLEASPVGTVRPCCLADDEIRDNAGEKFNLNTATFSAIQNSHAMRRLRQEFIDGKQPATCRRCWAEEASGRTSKRMHTLERLKHMVPLEDWTLDAKPLMFLDLKLGNICNLKCRICGSWSSSTYAVEELAHLTTEQPKQSFHYQMLKQGRWPRENPKFWCELDAVSDQIRYLEFTGGEPFMIEEHFELLQRLVDRGIAGNIEIHYNTNGSLYPANAEEIWSHFRLVEIAFSIDDTGARFEYQRSGARWTEVCNNINLFKSLRSRRSNIQLQVCCTVNALNALYLEETYQWIQQQAFDYVYWNMLHDAPHWSIVNLPLNAKKTITQRLQAATVDPATRREFDNIINFMNTGARKDGSAIRFELSRVDQRRGESLAAVMPELARMLGYYTNE